MPLKEELNQYPGRPSFEEEHKKRKKRYLLFISTFFIPTVVIVLAGIFYNLWGLLLLLPIILMLSAIITLIIFPPEPGYLSSSPFLGGGLYVYVAPTPKENVSTQAVAVAIPATISFPSHVVIGQTELLQIEIKIPQELKMAFQIKAVNPFEIDVLVTVYPSDFAIDGVALQSFELSERASSKPLLTFNLIPKAEGKKAFFVEFFQGQHLIARSEIQTIGTVQSNSSSIVTTDLLLTLGLSLSPIDLAILVDLVPSEAEKFRYRYRLISHIEGLKYSIQEFWSPETKVTPQGFLEETFNNLAQMGLGTVEPEVFFERLSGIGTTLYDRLFPDNFKRLYWDKLRNRVKSLIIYSDEPWVPWELIRPFDPDTKSLEDGSLCEKFDMSRWLRGRIAPEVIPSSFSVGLIVADSGLSFAQLEGTEIKKLFDTAGIETKYIEPSSEAIYHLLKAGGFSFLHFVCHGEYNSTSPDWSTIFLDENTTLAPIDISGDKLAFGKDVPFVFLNACETGRSEYTLTGIGGWAEAFIIRAGCSGFIGSMWAANDEAACSFARVFYQHLLEGKTVAEAVRLARLSIKRASDPTWLSYTLYANPMSRLSRGKNES